MAGNSSLQAEDILLQNLQREVLCSSTDSCDGPGKASIDIHVSSNGCMINGVQIVQSILERSDKVEFIGSMKDLQPKKKPSCNHVISIYDIWGYCFINCSHWVKGFNQQKAKLAMPRTTQTTIDFMNT
jgi:hypothetical protein